jgi:hypothetical protein
MQDTADDTYDTPIISGRVTSENSPAKKDNGATASSLRDKSIETDRYYRSMLYHIITTLIFLQIRETPLYRFL